MSEPIFREITPLDKHKLFFAKFTKNDPMTFPAHFHDDFEITLVLGANGKRIVGNSVEHFTGIDLAMIFPDALHGYRWDKEYAGADVVVIQFSKDVRNYTIFAKECLAEIGRMLSEQELGIHFSTGTALQLKEKIMALVNAEGIEGILLFIDILYRLAISKDRETISTIPLKAEYASFQKDSERINKIILFIEKNYSKKISLKDIGESVNMSPSAISRYFKRKTGYGIWDYLNNYRIDVATHKMIKTDEYIFEICYSCGFNNISNFNREFKKRIGITPRAYKKHICSML